MLLKDIKELLGCECLAGEKLLDRDITYCFGADLMSDVLRYARVGCLLLTGITNNQVLQVAEILDLQGIIFVRGKKPDSNVISQAEERNLPMLATGNLMFDTCGILYSKGLRGGKSLLGKTNEHEESIQTVVQDKRR